MREPLRFGTILVVGGGCYGSWYLRQLARAVQGGALACERIVCLDRDDDAPALRLARALARDDRAAAWAALWRQPRALPLLDGDAAPAPTAAIAAPALAEHETPPAARERLARDLEAVRALPLAIEQGAWEVTVPAWLDRAADHPGTHARDALVPSPLMPHLTADWVAARLARHRGHGTRSDRAPLPVPPPTPWASAAPDGRAHYASYATWLCPINCIEPATCPHTRGARDWSMPRAAAAIVDAAAASAGAIDALALFHTTHRTHGVGMFDLADAARAAAAIRALDATRPARLLVASVSHCHGAFAVVTG